jgi:hypothetical protein
MVGKDVSLGSKFLEYDEVAKSRAEAVPDLQTRKWRQFATVRHQSQRFDLSIVEDDKAHDHL